jgi:hypothetical protein
MEWFKFFPKEIAALTDGMTLEDYAITLKLISRYAANGKPIASESLAIFFPTASERAKTVLRATFTQVNQGDEWIYPPVYEQMISYEKRCKTNQSNASGGQKSESSANDTSAESESQANRKRVATESQANRGEKKEERRKNIEDIEESASADASASVPVADAPSPKRRKKKDEDIQYVDCPEGINPASWSEWMVIRKKKKLGGLTPYGLELLRQECSKADISLQRGIDHCIESGWGGFKAAYIANLPKEKPDPFRVKNPYIPPGIDPNAKVKPWPKTSPWDDPEYEAQILGAIRKSTGLDGGDSK